MCDLLYPVFFLSLTEAPALSCSFLPHPFHPPTSSLLQLELEEQRQVSEGVSACMATLEEVTALALEQVEWFEATLGRMQLQHKRPPFVPAGPGGFSHSVSASSESVQLQQVRLHEHGLDSTIPRHLFVHPSPFVPPPCSSFLTSPTLFLPSAGGLCPEGCVPLA